MPTIRIDLLITGSRLIFSSSICRIAFARSSSSRHVWMPGVITSRAIAVGQSFADDVAIGHHADQFVVLADRQRADVMIAHQLRKLGDGGVRADPVDALM